MDNNRLLKIFGGIVLAVGAMIALQSVIAVRALDMSKSSDAVVTFAPLEKKKEQKQDLVSMPAEPVPVPVPVAVETLGEVRNGVLPKKVLLDVPFTSQAPFGNWADERQDYGCEEASILMGVYWAEGRKLTPALAEEEIIAMSEFEKKVYGNFYDTSAADTLKVLQTYFGFVQARVAYDIGVHDIKAELAGGNVVVVPVNGRLLGNPYFTPPGPPKHKIVIRGYDDTTGEFITNDPGTKRGEAYRYPYAVMENALLDYPSGRDEEVVDQRTAMIVIWK